jgi:hypothetical protein
MVFGKHGRPLWRFSPPTDHGEIIRSPSLGFPLLHPAWMGRIEWFRRWRYDESTRLAADQELLQRSYRNSRFANLPQIVLGYREERITLGDSSNCSHIQYVCTQLGPGARRLEKLRLLVIPAARFAANCVSVLGGEPRMDHQAVQATFPQRSLRSGAISGRCSPSGMGGHAAKPSSLRHSYSSKIQAVARMKRREEG